MRDSVFSEKTAQAEPFMLLSDRVSRFRRASRARASEQHPDRRLPNLTRAFFELYADLPFRERYARAVGYTIENAPVHLFDDELLVGMLYQTGLLADAESGERAELWEEYSPFAQSRVRQQQQGIDPGLVGIGSPGHIGWRWDWILERGVEGHMGLIREHLARTKDSEAERFYRAALVLWQAALRWNDRHVAALCEKARQTSGSERDRIERLIEICGRVPRHPARNFHEAMQSYYFQQLVVHLEHPGAGFVPGRLDYFLWPFLERDLARGLTTLEQAKDLVDELFIRFEERLRHNDKWGETVMLGGVHPDGSSAVNPLSYLMIHSICALDDQAHPLVYARVSHNSPEDFLDLNVRYLLHGHNRAQVYNDDACIPAIVKSGTPFEDAVMYIAGGCMEPSVQGMNCDLNFTGTHNVAKTLELVLNGGIDMIDGKRRIPHQRELTDCQDFEDLYAAFEAELARWYRNMARALDIASECYAEYRPGYLLSSMMGDCLERGREQQDGGARYHEYGFAPLGVTSAADSLNGIKRAVFDQKFVSASELLAALRANFVGYEALRARLRRLPRYGVEDAGADAMCNRVMESVCTLATQQQTRFGGRLKPMIFNFIWTPGASRELGARGDGSCAGDPIGHGMTPQSSAMTEGITAAINSATALDYECVSGGATTMWDMDDQWINFDSLKAILQVFLARGGMIFQGNTTSVKDLEDALEHPDRYPNLIVRVGGFSARFVTLDRALQREIIARRRHAG
ncbi:MAG: hypothetical protein HYY04_12775 [Chloroflexi bacterium]|nr:hypothetical protein [Chloroflexota bacterium]